MKSDHVDGNVSDDSAKSNKLADVSAKVGGDSQQEITPQLARIWEKFRKEKEERAKLKQNSKNNSDLPKEPNNNQSDNKTNVIQKNSKTKSIDSFDIDEEERSKDILLTQNDYKPNGVTASTTAEQIQKINQVKTFDLPDSKDIVAGIELLKLTQSKTPEKSFKDQYTNSSLFGHSKIQSRSSRSESAPILPTKETRSHKPNIEQAPQQNKALPPFPIPVHNIFDHKETMREEADKRPVSELNAAVNFKNPIDIFRLHTSNPTIPPVPEGFPQQSFSSIYNNTHQSQPTLPCSQKVHTSQLAVSAPNPTQKSRQEPYVIGNGYAGLPQFKKTGITSTVHIPSFMKNNKHLLNNQQKPKYNIVYELPPVVTTQNTTNTTILNSTKTSSDNIYVKSQFKNSDPFSIPVPSIHFNVSTQTKLSTTGENGSFEDIKQTSNLRLTSETPRKSATSIPYPTGNGYESTFSQHKNIPITIDHHEPMEHQSSNSSTLPAQTIVIPQLPLYIAATPPSSNDTTQLLKNTSINNFIGSDLPPTIYGYLFSSFI